jgi:hypothetical protein
VWTLTPPAAPATADQLVLEVAVPYFDRPFELRARREQSEERVIASGRLARAAGDPRPVRVAFGPERFDRLELRVTDGDDAPLDLARVEGSFPVPEVFFAAPADVLAAGGSAGGDRAELRTSSVRGEVVLRCAPRRSRPARSSRTPRSARARGWRPERVGSGRCSGARSFSSPRSSPC